MIIIDCNNIPNQFQINMSIDSEFSIMQQELVDFTNGIDHFKEENRLLQEQIEEKKRLFDIVKQKKKEYEDLKYKNEKLKKEEFENRKKQDVWKIDSKLEDIRVKRSAEHVKFDELKSELEEITKDLESFKKDFVTDPQYDDTFCSLLGEMATYSLDDKDYAIHEKLSEYRGCRKYMHCEDEISFNRLNEMRKKFIESFWQ